MSVPLPDTTFGKIIFEGKKYKILNNPINEKIKKEIAKYKAQKKLFYSAPWSSDNYLWVVKNDKLYLKQITIFGNDNFLQETFNQDELFAKWQSNPIKLLISKKNLDIPNNSKLVIMKIKILHFKDGILIDIKDSIKKFKMRKNLVELGYHFD